jgi:signal transduction histidine kinase
MQVSGELVGVLSCGAWEPNAFGEVELAMLSTLADHAAVTLKVAQQLHVHREQAQREASFFMDAVHELKGPVHSIRGPLDILLQDQLGPITQLQREFLDIAREASQRLGDAISGLLEMGAAGRRPQLGLQTVQVEELTSEVVRRLRATIELHRVQVRIECEHGAPPVQIDPAAIQQVLVNLLANALKVSPAHSSVLLKVDQRADEVVFSVTDAGPGLPPEERTHVFSRYYQADPATRAPGEVGLGLALCRDIIEHHGGRIWAEDAEAGGARLSFALPVYVRRSS